MLDEKNIFCKRENQERFLEWIKSEIWGPIYRSLNVVSKRYNSSSCVLNRDNPFGQAVQTVNRQFLEDATCCAQKNHENE